MPTDLTLEPTNPLHTWRRPVLGRALLLVINVTEAFRWLILRCSAPCVFPIFFLALRARLFRGPWEPHTEKRSTQSTKASSNAKRGGAHKLLSAL